MPAILLLFSGCAEGGARCEVPPPLDSEIPLRELAEGAEMRVGTALEPALLASDARYGAVAGAEFNALTPENALKWSNVHPTRQEYDFAGMDTLMVFAEEHGMEVRGHTLVWPQPAGGVVPDYVEAATDAEELETMMREHFEAVMGRYRGRIERWDVVNEPLRVASGDVYEDNVFHRLLGRDYIRLAFEIASEVDPEAELWLNENNMPFLPGKDAGIVALVEELLEAGAPIDGVGLQTHLILGAPEDDSLEALIAALGELGVAVAITEFDLPVRVEGEEGLEWQAEDYRFALSSCARVPACEEITFWGFTDRYTWIDDFFEPGLAPLPLDEDYQRKPAYGAVQGVLTSRIREPHCPVDR